MKKFVYFLGGIFYVLCIVYIIFVVVIDPFYVFHMPIGSLKPIPVTSHSHYVARGLIRNMDYNMLICGSSMCENMHIDTANKIWGANSLKVIQYGSYSNDLKASLEAAAEVGKATTIIMALDTAMFQKPDEGYHPAYNYAIEKPSVQNIWSYLLNADVLKYAVDLIECNRQGIVPELNDWCVIDADVYLEKNVLIDYRDFALEHGYTENSYRDFDVDKAWNNLRNIEIGIKACEEKGILIKFFIPPYSIGSWDYRDYELELTTYKALWEELLQYSNVEIHAIQFDQDIITNLDNYRNIGHYNVNIADGILYDIEKGKYKLEMGNIGKEVDKFKEFLYAYNWKALRKKAGIN